jgi:hypothetical protein|tara:strand:+ start:2098 stop:2526 length:429 start_codon:yes stop_codon:yes gene_type:complete
MSTIYNNFGVDFETNISSDAYKIVSKTGEELHVNPETLQLAQLNTANTDQSVDGYKLDQVFTDFKTAGLTDKLANFYTITLHDISKKDEVDILSLYTKDNDNQVIISKSLLEKINSTLPNSVKFKNSESKTSDKYVRLLIGA